VSTHSFLPMAEAHLAEVCAIYNHYVASSTATFQIRPVTLAEMREQVFFGRAGHQAHVMSGDDGVRGYVLLGPHKKREAYDGTAEVSVYLRPDCLGQGLGKAAVRFIEERARAAGLHVLVATICAENEQSIRLFERHGYEKCAHFREVGRKFGRYLDVVAYQKNLASP